MFEYYYGNQTEQFNFVRVPWVLFTHGTFSCLSNDAKMLYALLLDRMSLSRQNGWLDDENRVYIVYTVEEAAEMLKIQCPDKYICAALYNAAYTRNISLFAGFTAKTGLELAGG